MIGCLTVVVIILVIAVFWKVLLSFFWYLILILGCAAVPVCRETVPPFTYWYFQQLSSDPVATITVSILVAFASFAAFDALSGLLYKTFAPRRIKNEYPELRDFKRALKQAIDE